MVLSHLRESPYVDVAEASRLLQLPHDRTLQVLDHLAQPGTGILERMGRTRSATFHLTKAVSKDLLGRAAYTRRRGIAPRRYAELVREFVVAEGSITPRECRELLGLGESQPERVQISKLLRQWSEGPTAFLRREGRGKAVRYVSSQGSSDRD